MGLPSHLNKRRPLPFGVFGRDRLLFAQIAASSAGHGCIDVDRFLGHRLQTSKAHGASSLDASGYEAREDGAALVIVLPGSGKNSFSESRATEFRSQRGPQEQRGLLTASLRKDG